MVRSPQALKAALMLLLATSFWGTTFLLMKALGQAQHELTPGAGTWFFASVSLLVRFGLGALILLPWNAAATRQATRQEWALGAGLGLFGGLGLIFQMDGVQHTPASTSAFLTQCYCIIIPVYVALRKRKWPAGALVVSCLLVMGGVAVLADVDWSQLRLGRGEAETIIASVIFTAQILWLERPVFATSRSGPVTLIMFLTVTLVVAPVVLATATRVSDIWRAYSSLPTAGMILYLTITCTVVSFTLMNRWQRNISATHASLIYCSEPLFTSLFALFLPEMLSAAAHIHYSNEILTPRLLLGGGLITSANIIVFWHASRLPVAKPQPATAPQLTVAMGSKTN